MDDVKVMKRFEVGKVYKMKSPCDSNCEWLYHVIKRTEKTITLIDLSNGKMKTNRVRVVMNDEACNPLGRYSMSPILRASKDI